MCLEISSHPFVTLLKEFVFKIFSDTTYVARQESATHWVSADLQNKFETI